METLKGTVKHTYDWYRNRIREMCKDVKTSDGRYDFRCVDDANAIYEEFREWQYDADEEIISLEYFGEGSEFDE